jgi:hypothetical protein
MMNDVYNQYLEAMIQVLEYGIVNNEFNISDTKSTVIQLMALLDGLLIYSIIGFQGLNEDQFEIYKNFVDSL